MSKTYTTALRWNSRNKIDIMKCYLVKSSLITILVSHSRVILQNKPSILPSDVGMGYNEELNYYVNANFINVSKFQIVD